MKKLGMVSKQLASMTFFNWMIVILVVIATFLRFWKLESSVQFLGDQGRDALIASKIFTEHDIALIGPTTSVGNMYLGPLYYYFMVPFLFLTYPSPMGPVYAVALLGVATVFFLYYWGKQLVGERAAILAAFLATFSATAVSLSRFSWNPNPAPFVSLLMIVAIYRAITKTPRYWILVGFCFSILLQLHYITILSGVAAGVIWLFTVWQHYRARAYTNIRSMLTAALIAVVILGTSLVPLVVFDATHGWLNAHSFQALLTNSENFEQSKNTIQAVGEIFRETHGRGMHVLFEFLIGKQLLVNRIINTVLLFGVVIYLSKYFIQFKKDQYRIGVTVICVYILIGILGLSTYKNTVFDHYIAYLLPASFLLLGFVLDRVLRMSYLAKLTAVFFLLAVLFWNMSQYSFRSAATDLATLKKTATSIHNRVKPGQKYAIALLTVTKDYSGMNYRYFLSTVPSKEPVDVSVQGTADLLFIIDEEKNPLLSPEYNDIYEVASFPSKIIQERYTVENGAHITVVRK